MFFVGDLTPGGAQSGRIDDINISRGLNKAADEGQTMLTRSKGKTPAVVAQPTQELSEFLAKIRYVDLPEPVVVARDFPGGNER